MNSAEYDYFSLMYEKYADMIYRISLVYMKAKADTEDITSDIFVKLMEKRPEFVSFEHEKAFIIKITVNLCKDILKSKWFRHESYDGTNILFELKLDKSKANPEKAREYLSKLENMENEEPAEELTESGGDAALTADDFEVTVNETAENEMMEIKIKQKEN